MQDCEKSSICDKCNLKYDKEDEKSHNCFDYMKSYIAEKNMQGR